MKQFETSQGYNTLSEEERAKVRIKGEVPEGVEIIERKKKRQITEMTI